jgi:hypothetical protein
MAKPRNTPEKFWRKVDRTGGPDSCWVWLAGRNKNDYGVFNINRRQYIASRLAFEFSGGELKLGLMVLHTCDNPPCCNPKHLVAGTNLDNVLDMVAKGRQDRGVSRYNAKLTPEKVIGIRRSYQAGELDQYELSERYGVSQTAIWNIIHYKRWRLCPG